MATALTLDKLDVGYDGDIVSWGDTQVDLLRAGRYAEVDWGNVIEELEGVAAAYRLALSSQIARILEHLLKLLYSPARDPQRGWVETVVNARGEIERILDDAPSLRPTLREVVERNAQRTARATLTKLRLYDDIDRTTEQRLLAHRFTVEEVIGDWLPPPR